MASDRPDPGGVVPASPLDQQVDLAPGEAGNLDVEIGSENGELEEDFSEQLRVSFSVFAELIVGDLKRADLRFGEMLDPDDWDSVRPNFLAAMTRP